MLQQKIRVRFAPSPTGPLHIGGVRTALYNYLFAQKHGGDFILRIEDTDQGRFVPGAEEYIIESLKWSGIHYNEGVGIGGPHAPYRQSERKDIYKQYAEQLINNGHAYYAFDTADELDAARKNAEADKKTFQYGCTTRMLMNNSLQLTQEQIQKKLQEGCDYVIRFKIPENEMVLVNDLIRGEVQFQSSLLDDKVLFKSDGMPTYHLANVVDDHLMEISHVIRGEEWLPSAPLHVLLYRALDWENTMPAFAHLPLILKPEGNGKLSKRDGDKGGFPVFPLQWQDPFSKEFSSGYRESGYLPDAFINMLVFLGWNPGTEKELFSLTDLTQEFSLERVGKSGAKFDPEKTRWFNHQYIQAMPMESLEQILLETLKVKNIDARPEKIQKVCALIKERLTLLTDIWPITSFFFVSPEKYDEKSVKDKWKNGASEALKELCNELPHYSGLSASLIKEKLHDFVTLNQIPMGTLMNALRISLVGASSGPDLAAIIELLGPEECHLRIQRAIEIIAL